MTTNDTQTTATQTAPHGVKPYRLIKLGMDVHWRQDVVWPCTAPLGRGHYALHCGPNASESTVA